MTIIDRYSDADATAAHDLWQAALGQEWPIPAAMFRQVLVGYPPNQRNGHFLARDGNRIVGLVATQVHIRDRKLLKSGHVQVLAVHPQWQRKGIGKSLLNVALEHLRSLGATSARLGGLEPRFWPGVPVNLPIAIEYFRALGWHFESDPEVDLLRDLSDYTLSADIRQRMDKERITLAPASQQDVQDALAFEAREFPGWLNTFQYVADVGDYDDLLLARDPDKGIVGTLAMYSPRSSRRRAEVAWHSLLGETLGKMGEVGVAQSERGRGIGVALVAYGSEILKARGVGNCHIGWTSLADFYGKVGYKVWREYAMASLEI